MKKIYSLLLVLLFCSSCLNEIDLSNFDFEEGIVIEARLTDQITTQRIELSWIRELNSNIEDSSVSGAKIELYQNGVLFQEFNELQDGVYSSTEPFGLIQGNKYYLEITTDQGIQIQSEESVFLAQGEMTGLQPRASVSSAGKQGVQLNVSGTSRNEYTQFFRYEIVMHQEIKAPAYSGKQVRYTNIETFETEVFLNRNYKQTCYKELINYDLILNDIASTSVNFDDFELLFIDADDERIANNLGVLVKQYAISEEAYNYYSALKRMNLSDEVFTNAQPGFLQGNLQAINDEIPVYGYFEMSSYHEESIVFNYFSFSDSFDLDRNKRYPEYCVFTAPRVFYQKPFSPPVIGELYDLLLNKAVIYFDLNSGESPPVVVFPGAEWGGGEGPYIVVNSVCADCSLIASPEKPNYWK